MSVEPGKRRRPKPYKARSLRGAQTMVRMLLKQRREYVALLEQYAADRKTLAKLAATGPAFIDPMQVWGAEMLRDEVLRVHCKMNPNGSPINPGQMTPA